MKKMIFIALAASAIFCSCESKGPKSSFYADGSKTCDEIVQDVNDAAEDDGWLHQYDTDVFYLDGGEWTCYGRVSVYKNMEDERGRKWVEFNGMKYAAEDTDKGGYSYKVQYGGTWFYF